MLRTAAIASLGLRRLLVASTTTPAPGSQSSLLLRFISGHIASPEPAIRRILPTLDLTRSYARGRQPSHDDDDEPDGDFNDEDMDNMRQISDIDDNHVFEDDDDLDEDSWDPADDFSEDSD